jgi:hypothetical protein
VCNSANSELNIFAAAGGLIKRVQLQDWIRGLAVTDVYVLVGESVNRQLTNDLRGATVAILDRSTWTVLGRLTLPSREVYDLVLASPELLRGILQSPNPRVLASCPHQLPLTPSQMTDAG